jgi:uncharacterized protein
MSEAGVVEPNDRFRRLASPVHTLVVIAVLAVWTYFGANMADRMRAEAHPNRVRMYLLTLAFEWLLLGLVVWGVRRGGTKISLIMGNRWASAKLLLRDIGIALAFLVVSAGVLNLVGMLLGTSSNSSKLEFMAPRGAVEIALWLLLSTTAGICEEAIFRGYFQRQLTALTHNTPTGIALAAVLFGAAHAYQGFRMVVLIAVFGSLFGVLAYWRRSVRPGMIAHTLQDALSGLVVSLQRH